MVAVLAHLRRLSVYVAGENRSFLQAFVRDTSCLQSYLQLSTSLIEPLRPNFERYKTKNCFLHISCLLSQVISIAQSFILQDGFPWTWLWRCQENE